MKITRILAVVPKTDVGHGFIFARRQIDQLRTFGCDVEVFQIKSRSNIFLLLDDARRFKHLINSFKPDLVHAHYGSVIGLFSTLFSSVPVVITYRGSDLNPNAGDNYIHRIFTWLFSQTAAFLASRIICVSSSLKKHLFWNKNKSTVLPTGVCLNEFFPIERDDARSMLNWSESDRIIIFNTSSNNNPNKRLDLANAATKIVSTRVSNVRLVVLNGSVPPEMINLYMNASDVLLMCSEYEGSPTVVQEALACNLPICSVDVGDVKEMIYAVTNCCLVDRNPVAIAEGLFRLIEMPLRSDGRHYSERYASSVGIDKLISIFRTLH